MERRDREEGDELNKLQEVSNVSHNLRRVTTFATEVNPWLRPVPKPVVEWERRQHSNSRSNAHHSLTHSLGSKFLSLFLFSLLFPEMLSKILFFCWKKKSVFLFFFFWVRRKKREEKGENDVCDWFCFSISVFCFLAQAQVHICWVGTWRTFFHLKFLFWILIFLFFTLYVLYITTTKKKKKKKHHHLL